MVVIAAAIVPLRSVRLEVGLGHGAMGIVAVLLVDRDRISLWIVAAGLALHGVFDFTRHLWLAGRGVPEWWPYFCGAYDLAAPAALAAILLFGSGSATAKPVKGASS